MNIFVVDPNPAVCAQYLDDKRVVKMVLETCQLLNNATAIITRTGGAIPYKLTHMHHPCTLWAAECQANYNWLVKYFDYLCCEYTLRYQKEHKCRQYLANFQEYVSYADLFIIGNEIVFVNCTTNHKHIDNVFEAYKAELNLKWANDIRTPTWYGVAR